jgi:phosphatidylserine decarboxylase
VFFIPVACFLFFTFVTGFRLIFAIIGTIGIFVVCSVIFYVYFHRNPRRTIHNDMHAILSPADGKVVYIKKIKQGEIIESVKKKNRMKLVELLDIDDGSVRAREANGYLIGIELRLFDVHVTRAPITGKKVLDHHVSGRIVSMTNPRFEYINDRETVVLKQKPFDGSALQIAVVQIATFITRTVKSFVREKTEITQGDLLGMIRLGSQVDVVIFSPDVTLLVKEHDRVYAGISKLAEKAHL